MSRTIRIPGMGTMTEDEARAAGLLPEQIDQRNRACLTREEAAGRADSDLARHLRYLTTKPKRTR